MKFDGEFEVPGTPDTVIRQFTDVERMARCVPGAELEGQDGDGNWLGAMVVKFGPKKIRFKGKVAIDFDIPACRATLDGRGAADARAARFRVVTHVHVVEAEGSTAAAPLARVILTSDAELTGVLAAFAGAGGTAVGKVLMAEFARNMAAEYTAEAGDASHRSGGTVSAGRVLWSAVRGDRTPKGEG